VRTEVEEVLVAVAACLVQQKVAGLDLAGSVDLAVSCLFPSQNQPSYRQLYLSTHR